MKFIKKQFFKPRLEEPDSDGSWAISYGDILTLLLSFFVVFFTTDFNQRKVDKLNRHLIFDIENVKDLKSGKDTKEEASALNLSKLGEFAPSLKQVDEYIVVNFGGVSFFDSGSVVLRKDAEELLKKFAEKYVPYVGNYHLSVKGFTDNQPVLKLKRKFEDNVELSALRAISAMRVLQKNGIPLNRMEIAGLGEIQTINKTMLEKGALSDKEQKAFSRKIVLVIKPVKESFL